MFVQLDELDDMEAVVHDSLTEILIVDTKFYTVVLIEKCINQFFLSLL